MADEKKSVRDYLDPEEAKPAPGAEIFEAGDLVRGTDGKPYLVTWPNATPDGTPLDRMPALRLTADLRGVEADRELMSGDVAGLIHAHHLDFETTRRLHWSWFAGLLPNSPHSEA